MKDLNMDLDDGNEASEDFTSDSPMPNIWSIDEKDDDTDASDDDHPTVVSSHVEEELEKPSFLRRLAKRNKDADQESDAEKDDK
jgi:hypothetical protein